MKKKKTMIIMATAALMLIFLLIMFVFRGKNGNIVYYKTEGIQRGNIESIVSATGSVNPVTIVEVGSQVSGKISKLYVDFNSRVKADQVLAEIDPSQILTRIKQNEANYKSSKAALDKSKVTLHNLEKMYKRALQLFEKDLISIEEKDSTEAQYLSAKTDVQAAEARLMQSLSQLESSKVDLGYTVIKSPIDGVVILRNINIGQTVAASFQAPVLFKIANDLSKMQVECSIDEADIGRIKEGQEVKFTVDAFPNQNFRGKVMQVRYSPEVVQNVVTYTTIVEVDNPDLKLLPGMTATVSIITGKAENVLMIPNAALRFTPQLSQEEMRKIFEEMRSKMMAKREEKNSEKRQGGESDSGRNIHGRQSSRVWVLDEKGKLIMVMIKTGVSNESMTELIRGDLKEGQMVLIGTSSTSNNTSSRMRRPGRMIFR